MDAIKQNKKFILLGCAVLAFILMAFAPAVDVLGKATINGFKYVFEADGAGFSRFTMLLAILAPLGAGVVSYFMPEEKQGPLPFYCFLGGVVLSLLTLICLPEYCGFAWGAWLSLILGIGGAVVAYITNK